MHQSDCGRKYFLEPSVISNYVSNDLYLVAVTRQKNFMTCVCVADIKKLIRPLAVRKPTEVYLRERGICAVGVSVKRHLIKKNITSLNKYTFKMI